MLFIEKTNRKKAINLIFIYEFLNFNYTLHLKCKSILIESIFQIIFIEIEKPSFKIGSKECKRPA